MLSTRFVSVALFTFMLSQAQGCSCLYQTFKERYDSSATVVKARVLSVRFDPTPAPVPCPRQPCPIVVNLRKLKINFRQVKIKFRLLKTFKGCGTKKVFFGTTNASGAACGFVPRKGELLLLNLGRPVRVPGERRKMFNINSCQLNREFSTLSKKELRTLRKCSRLRKNQCRRARVVAI